MSAIPGGSQYRRKKEKVLKRGKPFKGREGNPVTDFYIPHGLFEQIRLYPYHVWLNQSRWDTLLQAGTVVLPMKLGPWYCHLANQEQVPRQLISC